MADSRVADIDQAGPVKRRTRGLNFSHTPSPLLQSTSSSDIEPPTPTRRKRKSPDLSPNSVLSTQTNGNSAQQQSSTDTSNAQQPAVTRSLSLFGSSTQTQQPQGSSSLFGGQQNQQQQQQQNTSSLFGGNMQSQGAQNAGTSSLFGGNTQQQNTQNTQAGGLFGGSTMNRGTGLFGSTNTMPPAQTGGSSLFGGQQNQQQQGTSSLFGGQQNQQQGTSSLFGAPQNQQQQPQQGQSLFGLTATQPGAGPSLLGASTHRVSQYTQFPGRLTMGQQATGAATGAAPGTAGASTTGQTAAPINYDSLRPTTRFNDCIPQIQGDLEKMDAMIAAQERFCREIEAFIPMHGENVRSLKPDVELITEKVENAESALSTDAQQVESEKAILAKDGKDGERIRRVVDNFRQPREYQYTGLGSMRNSDGADGAVVRDMDLIGNYFVPLTANLQNTVNSYSGNLAEIEQHLRVIEASAVAQAQQLAAKRAGVRTGDGQSREETVRELAETLRGFEASILGAASQVGQCREGLNELVLGRLRR